MYSKEIPLSRHMIEFELFPWYRKYSEAQQGKINPIIHSYLTLVFLGDFHNHMEVNTHKCLQLSRRLTTYADARL